MNERRYTAFELNGMRTDRLAELMVDLGLPQPNKNITRPDRAKRVLRAYADLDAAAAGAPAGAGDLRPANAAFEGKLEAAQENSSLLGHSLPDAAASAEAGEARAAGVPAGWGGAREGAGRPRGTTAEVAMMNRLSEQPHPAIKKALEMLFEGWSVAVGCDAVALTEEEAVLIGLRWTNGLELIGVAQKIPVWMTHVIELVWDTFNIIKLKARVAREARDATLRAGKQSASTTTGSASSDPIGNDGS